MRKIFVKDEPVRMRSVREKNRTERQKKEEREFKLQMERECTVREQHEREHTCLKKRRKKKSAFSKHRRKVEELEFTAREIGCYDSRWERNFLTSEETETSPVWGLEG